MPSAWYTVHLDSPSAGTVGSSAASITSGGLTIDSSYDPDNDGTALVYAGSASDAIRLALTGAVTVDLSVASLPTTEYTFGLGTSTTTLADHLPFLLTKLAPNSPPPPPGGGDTGEGGSTNTDAINLTTVAPIDPDLGGWRINLEDLASYADVSDWDYNDFYWGVTVAAGTAPVPRVWITADQDAHEQNEQIGWFTVHRSDATGSLTVNYGTPAGTAMIDLDYIGPSASGGSVTFVDGETEKRIEIQPLADTEDEDTETISITLSQPTVPGGYEVETPAALPVLYLHDKKEVNVEITDAAGKVTKTLRVARWENAFKRKPGDGVDFEVVADFIDKDPDRFGVRVTDAAANKNAAVIETLVVMSKMTSDDKTRDLTLTETGPNTGVFVTKSLLLTSIQADDRYKVDGVANLANDDRTFRLLSLGEKLTVTYGAVSVDAVAPVEKVVKLHLTAVRLKSKADGGTASFYLDGVQYTTEEDVTKYAKYVVTYASWVYAPLGIRFELVGDKVDFVDPPQGVDLEDGLTGWTEVDGKIVLSAEEKAILDAPFRTAAVDDIEVYLISDLKIQGEGVVAANGESIAPSYSPVKPNKKYDDSIFLGKVDDKFQVLAHEIGHILLDDKGHLDSEMGVNRTRLMSDYIQRKQEVFDSLRFTSDQAKSIVAKRKDLLHNPPA